MLARALINQPQRAEPLGALDLKLRQQMQSELKALRARSASPSSTSPTTGGSARHERSPRRVQPRPDRADRHAGAIYERPATAFVAGFVGASNIVAAATAERLIGRAQAFSLRPERIRLGLEDGDGTADHGVDGTVIGVQYHGASTRVEVAFDGRHVLMVDRPNDVRSQVRLEPGSRVRLSWTHAVMQPLDSVES